VSQEARRAAGQPAPGEQAARFTELEAYRGVAALLIVVFHAYQFSREGTGTPNEVYAGTPLHPLFHNLEAPVAWFFVLSGFLLFLPFARAAVEQGGLPSSRGFLVRRAIRVLPPYYLVLLPVWAWRFSGGQEQWRDLGEHLTFTQVFDRTHIFWTIGPAWSLAVEVQFYLLLAIVGPLAYAACARLATRGARTAALLGGTGTLVLGSLAYKWWAGMVAQVPREDYPVYFGLLAKLDTFALGMLLAILVGTARRRWLGGAGAIALRLGGVGLLAATFALREGQATVDLFFHSLAGLAFLLVLASTTLGSGTTAWGRVLARPALQALGAISYSVYLWHEPLLIELGKRNLLLHMSPGAFPRNALVLVLLALAVATISYRYVERPIGELRQLFTRAGRLEERYPGGARPAGHGSVVQAQPAPAAPGPHRASTRSGRGHGSPG
jgi:peptidoglycan/LPS O-acetylase OafA/YrhL